MVQTLPSIIDDFLKVFSRGDLILEGFLRMVQLYTVALVIGFFLGLLLAITRQYGGRIFSRIAVGYIEFFRGTPLVVQLLLFWTLPQSINVILRAQGLPTIEIVWSIDIPNPFGLPTTLINHRIFTTLIALSLNSAAYQAEYFRGAILSVGAGQLVAAQSLGMSRLTGIRTIILPQALRRMIPAWSNEVSYLPKGTVIGFIIGVVELFAVASKIVAEFFVVLPTYIVIALIFFGFISIITWLLDKYHERTRIPGL